MLRRARTTGQRAEQPRSPVSFCVVDPGSHTLRLLVVEAGSDLATVWGWAEAATRAGDGRPDEQWLADACGAAMVRAEEMAQNLAQRLILPDRLFVGLPGELLRGWAWPIAQRRARPERPVEERELDGLMARAMRLTVNRLRGSGEPGEKWLAIDAAPVAVTIDGRGVTDPVGFRGQELGATVFGALAPATIVEVWKWLARELEFSELIVGAAPLALAAGSGEPQVLLVDVGGTSTSITWARAGRPLAVAALPLGVGAMTEALVRRWHLNGEKAERLLKAYAGGELGAEARAEVQQVLLPATQAWLEQVEDTLATMGSSQDEPLPQQVNLLGGGSALPEVADSLRALAWSRKLRFGRYPQVRCLRPAEVPGVVNRTELGRQPGDAPALALAAWTVRQGQAASRVERLLAGMCQP